MNLNSKLDTAFVRSHFPALKNDFIFMDNAGGSQILGNVIERMEFYMKNLFVQLGASYKVSANAGDALRKATKDLSEFVNARHPEEIILGSSTTSLLRILSICFGETLKKGDEIIVTNTDHEANVSCWMDLKKKGINIKIWEVDNDDLNLYTDDLLSLLSPKTRLVAMTHCSNILGTINPVSSVAEIVHDHGALLCVDGVAYAPHREIDVQSSGADFYVYSYYKTFGTHAAMMWGKKEILDSIPGINHYFIDSLPYKFQPGNFNFESCYGLAAIPQYVNSLNNYHFHDKGNVSTAFSLIADHEEELCKQLLDYLNNKEKVRIIGNKEHDKSLRVSTISFVHQDLKSDEIVRKVDPHNIGIRFGDFYAKKLVEALGLENKNGVVRVSMVHYNTIEEVNKLINVFETVL